jgi:DNA topoisomerase I
LQTWFKRGEQKKSDVPLEETCPQCGNNLVLKHGGFGEFTACSNYPKCKFVKQKTIGVPCPNCSEGQVVERRSKRGKTFYGCNRYQPSFHGRRTFHRVARQIR